MSILRGGFAAAHAFLSRNGPSMDMGPEQVLIEYDPDISLFAQLETARQEEELYKNAPATAKTAMTLQKIIDRSMVRLTLEEQRINDLANELAKPETVDLVKHKVVNSLASFGRVKFMKKKDEGSEEDTELGQEEDKGKLATALSSLRQKSSGTSPPDSGSKAGTSPGSEQAEYCDPLANKEKDDSASKISSAFASLSHLMQQSTKNATLAPMEDKGKSTLDDNLVTNESVGSKMSFSSFANRIKQVKSTETKGTEEKDDSTCEKISATSSSSDIEMIDGGDTSGSPNKLSSAVASLTQRIQQSTITGDTVSSNSLPTAEVDSVNKESVTSNASFSSFAKRIKFGQKATDHLPSQPGKSTEAKEPTNCKAEESKKMDTTDNASGGGRFGKFSMSLGGSLPGLKYKAVDAKISHEKKEISKDDVGKTEVGERPADQLPSQPGKTRDANDDGGMEVSTKEATEAEESKKGDTTDNATGGGRFGKFSMSLGGNSSAKISNEKQEKRKEEVGKTAESEAAKTNPAYGESFIKFSKSMGGFASLLQTKSVVLESNVAKFIFEDEPRSKSRFERLKESEESISFGDDKEERNTAGTRSSEGDDLNLFSGIGAQPKGDLTENSFADVLLSSSEEAFTDVALSSSSEEADEKTVASLKDT